MSRHANQAPRARAGRAILALGCCLGLGTLLMFGAAIAEGQRSASSLYEDACAACHGIGGSGRSAAELGFDIPMPDFTDCSFASREPDADWYAVVHAGGPVRAFDRMMPAFGEALSGDEMQRILDHVRGFCTDPRWPRGELNLPRPLVTEKAFPEDEAVVTLSVPEGGDRISSEWLYEKRLGPRSQFEINVPLTSMETGPNDSRKTRVGDIGIGFKHVLYHSLARGSIFSAGAEIILPTGDEGDGFGSGSTIFEPYLAYGRILPSGMFLQVQALGEFPADSDLNDEAALRTVFGRTWAGGPDGFGRAWTPMIEALVFRELESGADTMVDIVPQLQVTLPTRQHVMLNAGLRIPVNKTEGRDTQFMVYLLWDWFDGGLTEGW